MREGLAVEEHLEAGLAGKPFVRYRPGILRCGGPEGEDKGGEPLVRYPVRVLALGEEVEQAGVLRVF